MSLTRKNQVKSPKSRILALCQNLRIVHYFYATKKKSGLSEPSRYLPIVLLEGHVKITQMSVLRAAAILKLIFRVRYDSKIAKVSNRCRYRKCLANIAESFVLVFSKLHQPFIKLHKSMNRPVAESFAIGNMSEISEVLLKEFNLIANAFFKVIPDIDIKMANWVVYGFCIFPQSFFSFFCCAFWNNTVMFAYLE